MQPVMPPPLSLSLNPSDFAHVFRNAELDQHTVIFFFREAPTPGWKEEGVTPMDALFRTCAMGWGGTPVAYVQAHSLGRFISPC